MRCVRDRDRDNVSTAGIGIAAAAGVTERKVALIPGDENDRVAVEGLGVHNRTNRLAQELIARRNKLLLVAEITGIGRR